LRVLLGQKILRNLKKRDELKDDPLVAKWVMVTVQNKIEAETCHVVIIYDCFWMKYTNLFLND